MMRSTAPPPIPITSRFCERNSERSNPSVMVVVGPVVVVVVSAGVVVVVSVVVVVVGSSVVVVVGHVSLNSPILSGEQGGQQGNTKSKHCPSPGGAPSLKATAAAGPGQEQRHPSLLTSQTLRQAPSVYSYLQFTTPTSTGQSVVDVVLLVLVLVVLVLVVVVVGQQ